MYIEKFVFEFVVRPVSSIYSVWHYHIPFLRKLRELVNLTYHVINKRNRLLVVYTREHPIFNVVGEYPPEGILMVRITSTFKPNPFLNFLASKIDVIYEDGSTTFSLRTNQPLIREYEHPHFRKTNLEKPHIKKIFALSKWAKPNFEDPQNKLEVLYSSPVLPRKRPVNIHKSPITIFLSGGDAARKGVDILYYAFENLEKKFEKQYPLRLIMASNYYAQVNWYPVNQQIMEKVYQIYKKCRRKSNVYFGRIYPDALTHFFYKHADIYVLPTRYDTYGFSLLEAMSYGLPMIGTSVCAIPEIIGHEQNGFIIDVKDFDLQSEEYFDYAVKELEKYLTYLIEDPSLRLKMGEESRKRVERKFNLEYQQKRLKEVFEEAVK